MIEVFHINPYLLVGIVHCQSTSTILIIGSILAAKIDVLARHTAMNTAKMAQDGLYTMCRERALMNQRVAWRHSR